MRLREHVGAVRTQQRPGREAQTKQPGPSSQTRAAEARAAATMPPKGDDADFVPKKKEGECVKVVVRVRPLSRKEIQDGHDEATKADEDSGRITCQNPKADADEPPKTFTFDAVFAPSITQRKLYDVCSAPVVASVLEGFNGTIFAYGQTGAGKTFTMEGVQDPPELPRTPNR